MRPRWWIFLRPSVDWTSGYKRKIYAWFSVIAVLLLAALICSLAIRPAPRVVEKLIDVPKEIIKEVRLPPETIAVIKELPPKVEYQIPPETTKELERLRSEDASLKALLNPPAIVWPKTDKVITENEARRLLIQTFPNKRMTGAHFGEAALYTLDQFKEIRLKMRSLENNLPWPSLIDKALGTFQEPGIENLPVGWAFPTKAPMYLIVILSDAGKPKIFGFDPLDKNKIWEITADTGVEAAIVR